MASRATKKFNLVQFRWRNGLKQLCELLENGGGEKGILCTWLLPQRAPAKIISQHQLQKRAAKHEKVLALKKFRTEIKQKKEAQENKESGNINKTSDNNCNKDPDHYYGIVEKPHRLLWEQNRMAEKKNWRKPLVYKERRRIRKLAKVGIINMKGLSKNKLRDARNQHINKTKRLSKKIAGVRNR